MLNLILLASALSIATDFGDMPISAISESEILDAATKNKGFGEIYSSRFDGAGRRAFVVWWDPFSGIAATYFDAYVWVPDEHRWVSCVNQRVEGTVSSVQWIHAIDPMFVVRSSTGETMLKRKVLASTCPASAD